MCSENLLASCGAGGLEAADPWRASICGSTLLQWCRLGDWWFCHFLQLKSMGQGIVYEKRHSLNIPIPKAYLHFARVMYRLYAVLFAALKWAVGDYGCKFSFSMRLWERKLWILEKNWQRESWQNQKLHTSLKSDWAQLFKIWGLQNWSGRDANSIQTKLDWDLKCKSHGHQLIHQPNALHY